MRAGARAGAAGGKGARTRRGNVKEHNWDGNMIEQGEVRIMFTFTALEKI
jgi:hypothetical protein